MSRASGKVETKLEGWIEKWINCLKRYRKRWFVLERGTFRYYRTPSDIGRTCPAAIFLPGAYIYREDPSNVVVNGETQTFELRISDETKKRMWIKALEAARKEAMLSGGREILGKQLDERKPDMRRQMLEFQRNIEEQHVCLSLTMRHRLNLEKGIEELEKSKAKQYDIHKMLQLSEYFRMTTSKMIELSENFLDAAKVEGEKWDGLINYGIDHKLRHATASGLDNSLRSDPYERERKVKLGEELVRLKRQYSKLKRENERLDAINIPPTSVHSPPKENPSKDSISVEDTQSSTKVGLNESDPSDAEKQKAQPSSGSKIVPKRKPSDAVKVQAKRKGEKVPGSNRGSSTSPSNEKRVRRSRIPPKPTVGISLWSILKNCVGMEVSKIPFPVNFNEPLSMLQRLTEGLEYSSILDKAATVTNSLEQMAYVAAFTITSYSTTMDRTGKPFNPLLGETYEADRRRDLGWRSICEQVSHHPPAAAQFAEGVAGWRLWQEFTMTSKFRGKYMSIIPLGIAHLEFQKSRNHYTWRKVTTTINNIIIGTLRIENHGEMTIENHTTGDKCILTYHPQAYFTREKPRKVTGVVKDRGGNPRMVVEGNWDDHIDIADIKKVEQRSFFGGEPTFETSQSHRVWTINPQVPGCETMYHFTKLAIELNEDEVGVAPTDSRERPDQRLMENGHYDKANEEKLRLEEKQRVAARKRDKEAEKALAQGRYAKDYKPAWFVKQKDIQTGNFIHMFSGDYWKSKEKKDWSKCPNIF